MPKKKSENEERAIILRMPAKRPYGVKVSFQMQTAGGLGYIEEVCLLLPSGPFLVIGPGRSAPWEGGKRFTATLEGFATAAAAEAAGRRIVQAFLWMAVSLDSPLSLDYQSYEPATVFERNRSEGFGIEAYGEVGYQSDMVLMAIHDAYATLSEPDPRVLLSMEIFAGSRLETSQRARFLLLVSALEPLAVGTSLGNDVSSFIKECVASLRLYNSIPPEVRASLEGRLLHLNQESIRQALRRFTASTLSDDSEAPRIVDDAYSLRSQIVHGGAPEDLDIDLEAESRLISGVIRRIYASLLKTRLLLNSG